MIEDDEQAEYVAGGRPDGLLLILSRAVVEGNPVSISPELLARLLLYIDKLETMGLDG